MIDVVRNKCKSEGIDVLCESTDGQWARNCMRSKEGKPLTHIQYQKDVWNKFCRNSKVVLLETLMGYSKVDADCLNQLQNIQFPRNLTFEMGNIRIEYESGNGSNKSFKVLSVGSSTHKIPMIGEIRSTQVKSAWLHKGKNCI